MAKSVCAFSLYVIWGFATSCSNAQGIREAGTELRLESIDATFSWCPAGEVVAEIITVVGDDKNSGRYRRIEIPEGFWISRTELTQSQYLSVVGGAGVNDRDDSRPICDVSFLEAMQFCEIITMKDKFLRDRGLRVMLPSVDEWEYACLGGRSSIEMAYSPSRLSKCAWFDGIDTAGVQLDKYLGDGRRNVASKDANPWNIYDMLGNVAEWCELPVNTTGVPGSGTRLDGSGQSGREKAICGGAYCDSWRRVHHASRIWSNVDKKSPTVGFRVVISRNDP